jgi:hypothetical protein
MTIEIEGLHPRSSLRRLITKKLAGALARLGVRPTAVKVKFNNDNGPKGGVAIRCGITVELPRHGAQHIEHRAETERVAFDGAHEALDRRIERERGRAVVSRRRPKKYYLAKRLLMPDESLGGLAHDRAPSRRASLRRSA